MGARTYRQSRRGRNSKRSSRYMARSRSRESGDKIQVKKEMEPSVSVAAAEGNAADAGGQKGDDEAEADDDMKEDGASEHEETGNVPNKDAKSDIEEEEGTEEEGKRQPASTLKAVLGLLDLDYDEKVGLLKGDAIYKVPRREKLEEVESMMAELLKQIDEGVKRDKQVLQRYCSAGFESQIKQREKEIELEGEDEPSGVRMRGSDEERPTHTIIKISGGETGSGTIRIQRRKADVLEEDEESGAVKVKPHRRRSIIVTANGKRREITPAIAESDESDEDDISVEGVAEAPAAVPGENTAVEVKLEKENEENEENEAEEGFLASAYASKPAPDFDIKKLLKPTLEQLGMYDDEKARAESSTEREYMKKKLAVADYPESDLKSYLAGEIPTKDLSVNRPTSQVPFTSFENYVEPFFRNFTEEDVSFLRQKAVLGNHVSRGYDFRKEPFSIPALGPGYAEVWKEEDRLAAESGKPGLGDTEYGNVRGSTHVHFVEKARKLCEKRMHTHMQQLTAAVGDAAKLSNACVEGEHAVSCGPLTSRILSALVPEESFYRKRENLAGANDSFDTDDADDYPEGSAARLPGEAEAGDDEDEEDEGDEGAKIDASAGSIVDLHSPDYSTLDTRLKRELKYIGVYMNVQQILGDPGFDQDWCEKKEDDEVCREMRQLQKQLKAVQRRNNHKKRVLAPMVEEQIAWQEYMTVLEDLNKQVEQHYRRRLNVNPRKSRKRGGHHKERENIAKDDQSTNHLVTSASFQGLLAKRAKWIQKIGPLFRSEREMRHMPEESIFKNLASDNDENDDNDELEDVEDDVDEDVDVLGRHQDEVQAESLEIDSKD
ncbi:hypothetical protein HII12_001478 [Brettanomyces bruxellensis]|nr:hypothetical protein HII12_001478 [Brettanomyces bruxellensis]